MLKLTVLKQASHKVNRKLVNLVSLSIVAACTCKYMYMHLHVHACVYICTFCVNNRLTYRFGNTKSCSAKSRAKAGQSGVQQDDGGSGKLNSVFMGQILLVL